MWGGWCGITSEVTFLLLSFFQTPSVSNIQYAIVPYFEVACPEPHQEALRIGDQEKQEKVDRVRILPRVLSRMETQRAKRWQEQNVTNLVSLNLR